MVSGKNCAVVENVSRPQSKEVFALRYLVIGKAVNVAPVMQPQQVSQMIDTAILPSMEMLAKWEREGRIHGGCFAGQRAGCLIIDCASNQELDELLPTLPFWGLQEWEVTPLTSYESTAKRIREVSQRVDEPRPAIASNFIRKRPEVGLMTRTSTYWRGLLSGAD